MSEQQIQKESLRSNKVEPCYEHIDDLKETRSSNFVETLYPQVSTRYNPLLSLHDINHCHNLALSKLFKWYDLALSQKNLILTVIKTLQRDKTINLESFHEGLTSDNYEKIISDVTQRVVKNFSNAVDKNNIVDLLSFDPFYVN